jgi:hypothetical protein
MPAPPVPSTAAGRVGAHRITVLAGPTAPTCSTRRPDHLPVAKKADLEASFRACSARCAEAARAEADGDYPRALDRAEAALPLLREYVAFLRRYQKVEAPGLSPVDLIVRYAPPMFAGRSLDAVDAWVAEANRAERAAYPDLPDRLAEARRRLALAVLVWPVWPAAARNRHVDAAGAADLLDFWTRYGAVAHRPGTAPPVYEPVTHPRRRARGKCPTCGRADEAEWAALLGPRACPHCRATGEFAIVARTA